MKVFFMKIKMSILAIFLWTTNGNASTPAPMPQAATAQNNPCDPMLFDQMYHFIQSRLEFVEVDFQEVANMYKKLIALSASCEQYKGKLAELRTLIEDKAERYILAKVRKAHSNYKLINFDVLEPLPNTVKIKLFDQQGLPLKKALEVISIMNTMYETPNNWANIAKQSMHYDAIMRNITRLIKYMDTFIHHIIQYGKDHPGIYSFLNNVIDSWDSLNTQLVQAHLIPTAQSYQHLKVIAPETHTILAQIIEQVQKAGIAFAQWEEKKIQKDAPIDQVIARFNELFQLFDSGAAQLEGAINNAIAYSTLLMQQDDRQALEQSMSAFDTTFNHLNKLIDYATSIVRNYSRENGIIKIFNKFVKRINTLKNKINEGTTNIINPDYLSLPVLKAIAGRLMKVKIGSLPLPKAQNELEFQIYQSLKRESDKSLEEAWDAFNKIAQNKLSENVSMVVVLENIRFRLKQFNFAMALLSKATQSIVRLVKANYSSGNENIDRQEFEQNMVLLDELFNNFELFINELKKVSYNYSTPGDTSVRTWFDTILRGIANAINKIMDEIPYEIASSNSLWVPLLEKMNKQFERLDKNIYTSYFGQ